MSGMSVIPLLPPPPSKTTVKNKSPSNEGNLKNDIKPSGEVQNSKSARVYVFGDLVAEDEVDSHLQNNFELRPRGKSKHLMQSQHEQQEVVFLEREIKEGDTLEKYALLYGCSVAELKQTNKIANNQEFFAIKSLKIPVKKYGLLTESDEERKRRRGVPLESLVTSPTESYRSFNASGDSDDSDTLYTSVSIRSSINESEGKKFLQSMDKDLEKIVSKTRTQKESLEEVASFLNGKSIRPLTFPKAANQTENSFWTSERLIAVYIAIPLICIVGIIIYFMVVKYSK
ncbi:LysM and putative peptidoglycan-binding domain-containing protein 3 [Holothuria leucospilota]|uniref:LysM and putative peptidoglycan-binding domain-containing protein 3 n=1 Tax=Holothuria leucospilota TaxID=206669 RepID=A0A9Q1H0E2_HOLLE|nr:LysM and putative peptidoglycan-binding domain-containing protein 3 [Holothuria leucospilota]